MRSLLIASILFLPLLGWCQADTSGQGIKWTRGLTWEQVKTKAKAENKYIFVDCFATWCGPCKAMDKEVYADKKVGEIVNERFIAVRMQMDSVNNDDEGVRKWHGQVNEFKTKLSVNAFPTYLFFSPEGIVIHRDEGFQDVNDFTSTLKKSLDTTKQYYTLLNNYKAGKLDFATMRYLALTAKSLNETKLADQIAGDYLHDYLFKLSLDSLLNKKAIEFIYSFDHLIRSGDKGFKLFFSQEKFVDSVLKNPGLSKFVVDYIVTKEEINPALENAYKKKVTPDWKSLYGNIRVKFNEDCASRVLLNAKVNYYETVKGWDEYLKYAILKVQTNYNDSSKAIFQIDANIIAWNVFEHSEDKKQLNKALRWMRPLNIPNQPGWIDTYANLLYKLGRKEEAIQAEARAVFLALNSPAYHDIKHNFEKMKKNEKTWPDR